MRVLGTTSMHSCASLATLWQDVPSGGWYAILDRVYTERHDEPYCSA
ncbi:MAG: hypothetical protein JWP95_311 [Actinotalea sp.]|nr:hypothetical protein [Actinotalea sp.]